MTAFHARADVVRRVHGRTTEYRIEQEGATLLSAGKVTVRIERVEEARGEIHLWLKAWERSGRRKSIMLHYPDQEGQHTYSLGQVGRCKVKVDVNGERLTALTVHAPTEPARR
jgi:hypothetical protein